MLPDSSLIARRLCSVTPHLVAAPSYLAERGTPKHPLQLAEHACLGYAYQRTPDTWRFTHKSGEVASVTRLPAVLEDGAIYHDTDTGFLASCDVLQH